ncbi:MAG: hypothetical protein EBV05_01025 [Cyanobacteria bacterium WB6_1B_304]|jgi:signal transduction histidine kinase|nr:hypothetical protein [Cyanobacteria bacterium WB6_1B_304]
MPENSHRSFVGDAIWHQVVGNLGNTLQAKRCAVCPYSLGARIITVAAEYHPGLDPYPQAAFELASIPSLARVLPTSTPIIFHQGDGVEFQVAVGTFFNDQPNSLLLLQFHKDTDFHWIITSNLRHFFQGLIEQVGISIGYALHWTDSYQASQQLQQVREKEALDYALLQNTFAQVETKSRLKGDYLAMISHEMRTPLNGVIGFLKLILEGAITDTEEQYELIQESYDSGIHLLNIVNDVLDIAKIESGKMDIELSPVSLVQVLTAVESFIRIQTQQKKLSYSFICPDRIDTVIIWGNYQRLLQVLLNITGNAIKFTNNGGITIEIEKIDTPLYLSNQKLPGLVKIRVADTGLGVPLEKQVHLFQPYSQINCIDSSHSRGTGLGLLISQNLLKLMGGSINFFSKGEGFGSTVTFTVPYISWDGGDYSVTEIEK